MSLLKILDFIVLSNLLKSSKDSKGLKQILKVKMLMILTKLQQKLSLIMQAGKLKKQIYLQYLQKEDKLPESLEE
jgi:hypothetical protein